MAKLKGKPKTKTKMVCTQVSWSRSKSALNTVRLGRRCCYPTQSLLTQATGTHDRATGHSLNQSLVTVTDNPLVAIELREENLCRRSSVSESTSPKIDNNNTGQANNVRDVKGNFINLLRYDKLQYFYLGTLIYSVMNAGFIFHSIIRNSKLDSSSSRVGQTNSNHHLDASQSYMVILLSCFSAKQLEPIGEEHSWISLCTLLGFTLLLALIMILRSVQFQLSDHKRIEHEAHGNCAWNLVQSAGILLALLLLHLPIILFNLSHSRLPERTISSSSNSTHLCPELAPVGNGLAAELMGHHMPVGALVGLVYLQPMLLEGGSLSAKLVLTLTSLLLVSGALARAFLQLGYHHIGKQAEASLLDIYRADQSVALASCLPVALVLGLIRQRRFSQIITRDTFAGADGLIEAKVSLEHERQHQETLLLSVLPAYVAEQVKRNMLRKMASALVQSAKTRASEAPEQHAYLSSLSQTGPSLQRQSHPVVVPTQGTDLGTDLRVLNQLQGIQLVEKFSVDSGSRHQASDRCGGQRANTFHQLPQRLTSGLASSAAFLADTLGSNMASSTQRVLQATYQQPAASMAPPIQTMATSSLAAGQARRGFNELYIRTYNNVSLLYGDIVGFTRLCTQLSSSQLVRVLNDLFSHFDILAERHRIMRIKILGDCYYGVSGIPEFAVMGAKSRASRNDNHAINCVNMGLDMIHYIRRFNIERSSNGRTLSQLLMDGGTSWQPEDISVAGAGTGNVNDKMLPEDQSSVRALVLSQALGSLSPLPAFELNMRIGVHTGHIHSGVIGLKKWQFDVWSNDVSIAMHCESSGVAGRVQVTEATIQQLNGAFSYEPASGAQRDPFLADKDIRTYLINDRHRSTMEIQQNESLPKSVSSKAMLTNDTYKLRVARKCHRKSSPKLVNDLEEDNIRAATINTIRQTLLAGDSCNTSDLNSRGLALNHHDMRSFSLSYRDSAIGKLYSHRPVDGLLLELIVLLSLVLLIPPFVNSRLLLKPEIGRLMILLLAVLVSILLLASLLILNRKGKSVTKADKNSTLKSYLVIRNKRDLGWISSKTHAIRKRLFCLRYPSLKHLFRLFSLENNKRSRRVGSLIAIAVFIALLSVQCYLVVGRFCDQATLTGNIRDFSEKIVENSSTIDQYQLTVILLLICIDSSVNLVSYKTKFMLTLTIISFHLAFILKAANFDLLVCPPRNKSNFYYQSTYLDLIEWSTSSLLLMMAMWSLVIARQIEYTKRANFLWRNRLNVDHEELEYISGINKVLLENILPSHLVQHYLAHPDEQPQSQIPVMQTYKWMNFNNISNRELYHEQHDSVAVMFASIPHFYEFYDETDISKQGLGCIALLNEIICDFDKLLLKNKFSRIEKIKTIGSTYMAAAGLRPCNPNSSRSSTQSQTSPFQVSQSSTSLALKPNRNSRLDQMALTRLDSNQSKNLLSVSNADNDDERKLVMSQQKLNLICMVQFAMSLMTALNGINKQSFQVFKLRVGVNTGPVIAGVIGAQRPFYDIWGDCVNIASRMETLGEVGRIQVEEKTAKMLLESCTDTYTIVRRGPIDVKGKGGMITYFIDKRTPPGEEGVG